MKHKAFIMPCYNLHDYAGHEFMYTKEILAALEKKYKEVTLDIRIFAREDVNEAIKNELNCLPHFSYVKYRQDDSIFTRISALINREYLWFKENKRLLNTIPDKSMIFVHSFSIYSSWQWLMLQKYIKKNGHELKLVFRYSERLLPSYLKRIHRLICKHIGKYVEADMFTDSLELKIEYEKYCKRIFTVLPVMAETEIVDYDEAKSKIDNINYNIAYLGAARYDKGFHLLPDIIEHYCNDIRDLHFTIQCSIPGTNYLEKSCEIALKKIQLLSAKFPTKVTLISHSVNQQQYRELLKNSSILMLPYIGESYKTQTSGILVEALTNGIPCVVPSGTWLSVELSRTNGGMEFLVENTNTLILSLDELITNYPKYKQYAINGMDNEKTRFGAESQLKYIVGR
jgi:hypothetical protein